MMFLHLLFAFILSIVAHSCIVAAADCVPGQQVVSVSRVPKLAPPIKPDFVSFSIEVDVVLEWTDRYPKPPRTSFVNLMKQLGRPVLRIGGDSTDYSIWNQDGLPLPDWKTRPARYNITEIDVRSLLAGVQSYDGQLVFGLNFRNATNSSYAVQHLLAINALIGLNNSRSLLALEIGNEVDLYNGNQDRPKQWGPSEYYDEFEMYQNDFARAVPGMPQRIYQGATYCCYNGFEDDLVAYVNRFGASLRTLSIHLYVDTTNPSTTLQRQLSDEIVQYGPNLLTKGTKAGDIIALTRKFGIDVVVGEGNSNSEPGQLGVCDVFAGSALWVIDEFLNMAAIGLRRWHTHTHEVDLRAPFYLNQGDGSPVIRPLFYGLRFVAYMLEGAPQHALMATLQDCTADPLIKTWAVIGNDTQATVKVAIIHKNLNATVATDVVIDLSELYSVQSPQIVPTTMYAIRMIGMPLQKENILLAGQTWTGSRDGRPVGVLKQETLAVDSQGMVQISVSPITAVLLSSKPFVDFNAQQQTIAFF